MKTQDRDPKLVKLKSQVREGQVVGFLIHEDGSLRIKGRWCLPTGELALKERILQEAHNKADLAVKKANAEIASERKKAINEIKNEISEISIDIAEHVVGREIDEKDHTELINDFIENIGD